MQPAKARREGAGVKKRLWQKRKAKLKLLKAVELQPQALPQPGHFKGTADDPTRNKKKSAKRKRPPDVQAGVEEEKAVPQRISPRLHAAIAAAAAPAFSLDGPASDAAASSTASKALPRPAALVPAFEPPPWDLLYDANALELRVQPLLSEVAIGIDIEWRPHFVAGRPQNPVALLQLSSRTRCVLVPIKHLRKPLPPSIGQLLASPRVWKLGCGVTDDAKKLLADCGLPCTPTLEVGTVAVRLEREEGLRFPGLAEGESVRPGLRSLALACGFDLEKPKRLSRSNWERRPLASDQQKYAAYDAYAGVWIARCLHTLHAAKVGQQQAGGGASGDAFGRWLSQQAQKLQSYQTAQAVAKEKSTAEKKKMKAKKTQEKRREKHRAGSATAQMVRP